MSHPPSTNDLDPGPSQGSHPAVRRRALPPRDLPGPRRRLMIVRDPASEAPGGARPRPGAARPDGSWRAPADEEVGDWLREQLRATLGRTYVIERELGGGGMSHVYVAEETALGRRVAIKVLAPELSGAVDTERFRREAQVAARLQHPHIVPVLAAGEAGGMLYYTMPFVEGQSLRARIEQSSPMPVAELVCVLRDVAKALACAHRHGVVHRDIKPENVLLHEGGDALVADFGIAKALSVSTSGMCTAAGLVVGTPAYISPEQLACDPATDHRADLYALGVIAYELLAGTHPFAGRSRQAVATAHMVETPAPIARHRADAPPRLSALVMRLLEKQPSERPASALDVLRELNAIALPSHTPDDVPAAGDGGWQGLLVAAATRAAFTLTGFAPAPVAIVPPDGVGGAHRLSRRSMSQLLAQTLTAFVARRSRQG